MSLISIHDACLSFSDTRILDNTELHIQKCERVCLVGRNGAGKSTLMKIINGEQILHAGSIIYKKNLVVARLQQDPPRNITGSVYDFVAEGVQEQVEQLKAYHAISQKVMDNVSEQNLNKMAQVQSILDHQNLWQLESHINDVLQQFGFKAAANADISLLSGGWLRRAALCRALVSNPDVLMLDEPTNHLDIKTIDWLETFLKKFMGSIIFISHDRSFIRNVATRIVDLDRGKLVSWPVHYDRFLSFKEEALRVEEMENIDFNRKLAQEEVWIRQGIKARRTRNEKRVHALKMLRLERLERRCVMGKANIHVGEAPRSGQIVFELENVGYRVNGKILIKNFSAQVQRGDKIALLGPNGCGKTTLLRLMLGQLKIDVGRIHCGTRLQIAYFDQHRTGLDLDKTVMANLTKDHQEMMVNGKPRHVLGYLKDFLFHPKHAMMPVHALSDGERNRLALACIFQRPSNLLILDEPTNDLDVETLELLEELVGSYHGSVLLVSHDRQFVDNTVTACWIFQGNGEISNFLGGYQDTQKQCAAYKKLNATPVKEFPMVKSVKKNDAPKRNIGKLSYNLTRELKQLPEKMEQLEARVNELQAQMNHPDFFSYQQYKIEPVLDALAKAEQDLEVEFQRWEELEALKNGEEEVVRKTYR